MGTKFRLTLLNFLEFFVWGSWLISFGGYMIVKLNFTGSQVGGIFATMGLASLFMPGLLGMIADRWINTERLLGICHLIGAGLLYLASTATDYGQLYTIMLLNAMFYMPTIALSYSVCYSVLGQQGLNPVKNFPPIRVWGTVGFIAAMWLVDLCGWSVSSNQLMVGSVAALLLGIYAFFLPPCPPARAKKGSSWVAALGLDAFVLFKQRKMVLFFVFAMLLGAALQITNLFGQAFLQDFANNPNYSGSFAVTHPGILMSVSQISETLFILAIPFFLYKFGIKKVMLISMAAWVLRFALFGIGNPGTGLVWLVLSMIVYGMAFDFFNISGSLFVEMESSPNIRSSSQGLFMIVTNGIGSIIGGLSSGWVVDYFTSDGVKDWTSIWFTFAAYALLIGIAFALIFKYKHDPETIKNFHH